MGEEKTGRPMTDDQHKKLGPFLATMVVAGAMIGSGIYLLPASLGAVGSISMVSWAAAAICAAFIAGTFAWLAIVGPTTAGPFSHVRDAYGHGAAFVTGVLYWAGCVVASAAVALAVSGYLGVFMPFVAKPPGLPLATVAIVWLFTAANMVGPRFVARLQSWTFLLGLAPVFLAAIGGWFYFHPAIFSDSWNVTGQSALAVVPRTTVTVFWAFLGIEGAIVLATRVRNPARDVPIATLGGLAIATAIYMAASAAIMGILPAGVLAKSTAPFASAVAPILGASVAGAVALCAMLKASGTLGASLLLTVESGESESVLGQVRKPARTPIGHRASMANLLFTGVLTSLVVVASASPTLARQFTIVTNVAVDLSLLVYAMAGLSLLRLAGGLPRAKRAAARAIGIGGATVSAALIAVSEPDLLVWSAFAILLAVGAYIPVRARRLILLPGLDT
jgi:arginine:agmatine antiporter